MNVKGLELARSSKGIISHGNMDQSVQAVCHSRRKLLLHRHVRVFVIPTVSLGILILTIAKVAKQQQLTTVLNCDEYPTQIWANAPHPRYSLQSHKQVSYFKNCKR